MPDFDVHFKSEPWPEHLPNPFANEIPKPKAFLMEATEHKKTPTNEGKRRHPPDGFYFNTGSACTCKPVCPNLVRAVAVAAHAWTHIQTF